MNRKIDPSIYPIRFLFCYLKKNRNLLIVFLSFSVACLGYVWCSIYSLMSVNHGLPSPPRLGNKSRLWNSLLVGFLVLKDFLAGRLYSLGTFGSVTIWEQVGTFQLHLGGCLVLQLSVLYWLINRYLVVFTARISLSVLSNARQAATLAAHKLCSSTKFVQWS